MNNSPALIWAGLKELGLRPCSDVFNLMTEDRVVEIYSNEGIQIFRNFAFYEFCSYSIEELYCGHWTELFDRSSEMNQACADFLTNVFTGKLENTADLDFPLHQVWEIYSPLKVKVELKMIYGSPLFQVGTSKPVAAMVIEKAKIVSIEGRDSAHSIRNQFESLVTNS